MLEILKRFAKQILGILNCFDRVIIRGSVPPIRYADGMTKYIRSLDVVPARKGSAVLAESNFSPLNPTPSIWEVLGRNRPPAQSA